MPWWNREKRKELAEKKERQEKQKQAEEEKRIEEVKRQEEEENAEKNEFKGANKVDGAETKISDDSICTDNISKTAIEITGIVNEIAMDKLEIENNNNKILKDDKNSKIVNTNKQNSNTKEESTKFKKPKGVSVMNDLSGGVTSKRIGTKSDFKI